jgi:hypothetical protein
VTSARPAGPAAHTAPIAEITPQAAVLTAELAVDRAKFGMTWSPLHMSPMTARGIATVRFTRA